jgi:hypothetical protein
MEINKTQTNNSWQCRLFVDVLIDLWQQNCQMEIDKTEINNFRQCQSFVNVSIDSWQQKFRIEIDKTETNNFWPCRSFVNVSIDSWQHTCRMEINKNEMNKFQQCQLFVDKMIVELFPTSSGALPSKLMYREEASSTLIVALMFGHTRIRNLFNNDYQLVVTLIQISISEGAQFAPVILPAFTDGDQIAPQRAASKLIVIYRNSKISLHFCKDCGIFCEGEWEQSQQLTQIFDNNSNAAISH